MTEAKPTVTRPAFEELIARALEIQDRDGERVELDRARAIALDLGVSPEAWATALEERQRMFDASSSAPPADRLTPMGRQGIAWFASMTNRVLFVTAGLGAVSAFVATRLGGIEIPLGAAGLAMGALIAVEGTGANTVASGRKRNLAWWASLTLGLMVGIGGPHPDPIAYGIGGFLLSESVAWFMRRRTTP
jgi:hypothetical protein